MKLRPRGPNLPEWERMPMMTLYRMRRAILATLAVLAACSSTAIPEGRKVKGIDGGPDADANLDATMGNDALPDVVAGLRADLTSFDVAHTSDLVQIEVSREIGRDLLLTTGGPEAGPDTRQVQSDVATSMPDAALDTAEPPSSGTPDANAAEKVGSGGASGSGGSAGTGGEQDGAGLDVPPSAHDVGSSQDGSGLDLRPVTPDANPAEDAIQSHDGPETSLPSCVKGSFACDNAGLTLTCNSVTGECSTYLCNDPGFAWVLARNVILTCDASTGICVARASSSVGTGTRCPPDMSFCNSVTGACTMWPACSSMAGGSCSQPTPYCNTATGQCEVSPCNTIVCNNPDAPYCWPSLGVCRTLPESS
jgi:hypothetical protein